MTKGNEKKYLQLGIPHGTAAAKLRKKILFSLIQKLDLDDCFQCGEKIDSIDNFSIEHKIPWMDSDNPIELFFDLDNIAFSHLTCNCAAARKTAERKHPNHQSYKRGCRCDKCKELEKLRRRKQRLKRIKT